MPPVALCLAMLVVLALAGCGGGVDEATTEPTLPAGLAQDLADQADAIALAYESGDECGAAQQADVLNQAVIEAVNGGKVPAELQESLQGTTNKLVNEINCPEPAPPPEELDCDQLEEEKNALEEEKEDTKGKGQKRQLEEQIKALDEQIKACKEGEGEEENG
jgi:hypothetical protein